MRDLESYVPKKLEPYFEEAFRDSDGIWFYFDEHVCFYSTGCGIVHEDTIRECIVAMKDYELYPDAEIDEHGYRVR